MRGKQSCKRSVERIDKENSQLKLDAVFRRCKCLICGGNRLGAGTADGVNPTPFSIRRERIEAGWRGYVPCHRLISTSKQERAHTKSAQPVLRVLEPAGQENSEIHIGELHMQARAFFS
jgi:hypothetical protein